MSEHTQALLDNLAAVDPDALRNEIDELNRRRSALMVLLRAARERQPQRSQRRPHQASGQDQRRG